MSGKTMPGFLCVFLIFPTFSFLDIFFDGLGMKQQYLNFTLFSFVHVSYPLCVPQFLFSSFMRVDCEIERNIMENWLMCRRHFRWVLLVVLGFSVVVQFPYFSPRFLGQFVLFLFLCCLEKLWRVRCCQQDSYSTLIYTVKYSDV